MKLRINTPFRCVSMIEGRLHEAEAATDPATKARLIADAEWAVGEVKRREASAQAAPEPQYAAGGMQRGARTARQVAATAKTWTNDEFAEDDGAIECEACGHKMKSAASLEEHSLAQRNSLDQGTLEELDAIEDPLGAGGEDEDRLAEVRAGIDAFDRYGGEAERTLMRQQGCSGRAAREQLAKDDRWRKYRTPADAAKTHKESQRIRSLLAARFREKVIVLPRNHTRADRAVASLDWH